MRCLEEERPRTEEELGNYREIINRQKAQIQSQKEQLGIVQQMEDQRHRLGQTGWGERRDSGFF